VIWDDIRAFDTTGAGDAFVAGFLTGVVKGWDLKRTGYLANVTAIGATTGVRTLEKRLRFMDATAAKEQPEPPPRGSSNMEHGSSRKAVNITPKRGKT